MSYSPQRWQGGVFSFPLGKKKSIYVLYVKDGFRSSLTTESLANRIHFFLLGAIYHLLLIFFLFTFRFKPVHFWESLIHYIVDTV